MTAQIDRGRLGELIGKELATYVADHPAARAAHARAEHLLGRVPMTWMMKNPASFPLYLASARGNTVTDLDGRRYLDFSLGDTAAMAGHSPQPVVDAVQRRFGEIGGATAMLPTEDGEWVGAELTRRFGLTRWNFALTATDANRWAIRLARAVTGRPKLLFHSYCYHGSVDESLVVADGRGGSVSRPGNVGAPVDVALTSRAAEFNDLAGLEEQLAHGDVAAVVMEPALTNIGIVLPEPGYLDGVRDLTRRHGTLLLIDETHTLSAGPGGCTRAWGLEPDIVVIGKAIGGGIPAGAYGVSAEFADSVLGRSDLDIVDMGGVGGTMAGNAVSLAAVRATLSEVLTDDAFDGMIATATRYTDGVRAVFDEYDVPWTVTQLGARAEYRFTPVAPRNGTEADAAHDQELDDYVHLALVNRGILLTPFHNMALMGPTTTADQVDTHLAALREVVGALVG